jgi:hypothetical protein
MNRPPPGSTSPCVRGLTVSEGGIAEKATLVPSVRSPSTHTKAVNTMGYGIGGILVLILVILAIIYFAKRV